MRSPGKISQRSNFRQNPTLFDFLEPRILFAAGPQLWFYVQTNLAVASNVTALTTPNTGLIDRAAAAGYTYMMLADSKLGYDGILRPNAQNPDFDPTWNYYANTATVINYAASRGITVVPSTEEVGRADWIATNVNENLIEGQSVIGANFTVSGDGKSLVFNPTNPTLVNTSFASASTGWALDPGRASISTTFGHTDSDSLKISGNTPGTDDRGFGIQTITLIPNQEYHVSFWVDESSNFSGEEFVKIYDPSQGIYLEHHEDDSALAYNTSTGGWQQFNYMFNSGSSTSVQLRVGTWGDTTGTMWFDDISVTETALVNVVQNASAPLTITRPNGTALTQGVDYNPVVPVTSNGTPYLAGSTGPTYATWENPVTVTIPAGSSLHAGDQVKINYSGVQDVYDGQYAVTLSDPAVQTYLHNNVAQIRKMYAAGTPLMLDGYDEIRAGNTEPGEIAAGLSAAQLLANSFLASYNTVRAVDPNTPIYTWSDMFDPYHNAVNNYYLWNGNLTPPPNALPSDVTVMNWNLGDLNQSLKYFAALGNQQIIAGDYGAANGNAEAQLEVSEAVGAANVKGLMFTDWDNDYSQLENYAAGAKAAWAALITPPTITNVYIRSSAWTSLFLNYLVSSNQGDATLGYRIPTGSSAQLTDLVWPNLNQLSIQFSENVTIAQAALTLTGLSATYPSSTFSYNSTTHTATWNFANSLSTDAYQLSVPYTSVADTAGNPLDGEWTDSSSTHSGNNLAGGNFAFHLNILPGDLNHSGTVDLSDYDIWFNHLQTSTFNPALGDLNASGFVDLSDFDIWFTHLQQTLSSTPLASLASSAPLTATTPSPGIAIPGSTLQPTTEPSISLTPSPTPQVETPKSKTKDLHLLPTHTTPKPRRHPAPLDLLPSTP